ncbi:hypothetical protein ACIQ4I_03950 [Rummeliibacillus sp. NPDC094406]|uniref:hypothetical protein n=1 Tax=Rummeliibacillus sp. NPDC094406 TaxID=3364511 RepID=UPI00380CBE4D
MMKFYSSLVFTVALVIAGIVYWDYTESTMMGNSENGMWKAMYKEQKIGGTPIGWLASIKQKNNEKVTVKKLKFLEEDKILVERTEFYEGRDDVDGTKYSLHPFSYPDIYLGDAPKESLSYQIQIIWEDSSGNEYNDKIKLSKLEWR